MKSEERAEKIEQRLDRGEETGSTEERRLPEDRRFVSGTVNVSQLCRSRMYTSKKLCTYPGLGDGG